MPAVPLMSGRDAVKVFQKFGWAVARPGNHIVMTRDGATVSLSIPDHKELAKGTLRRLIGLAGLTVEEFVAAT